MAHGNFRRHAQIAETKSYDPYAYAVTVIQEQHRLIHDGYYYQTSGKETALANAGVVDFLLTVPAGTFPHIQTMKLNFGRGGIDFVAYEGTTVSGNGSAITTQNVNRNSSNTPSLELYSGPTVTDVGTPIFTLWVPPTATGTGQSADGVAGIGQGSEWMLAPSTNYLVRITNNSGSTIDWSYEFSWYEIGYDS